MGEDVCMAVWNHFITDARVTKEATTLGRQGKSVHIIAIHAPGETAERETREHFTVFRLTRLIDRMRRQKRRQVPDRPAVASREGTDRRSMLQSVKNGLKKVFIFLDKCFINGSFFYYAWKNNAHIYHAHDLNTALPLYFAARLRKARFIYDAHEISTDRTGWKYKRWWALIERFVIQRCDGFITTNDTRAAFFKETYGIDEVTVIRNVPVYRERKPTNCIQRALGLAPDVPVILYQGGLQPDRGLELMVDVMRDIPDAVMVFIGEGKLRPILEKRIASQQLERRVKLLGRVSLDELHDYTCSATIGLQLLKNSCLNHYTACSNKLYEYLMAELPIVASDFPELRKVVVGEAVGLVVDPEDRQAVIKSIQRLLTDRDFYNTCRRNAARVKGKYTWSREETVLRTLYRDLEEKEEARR